jgi:hypothetical protein
MCPDGHGGAPVFGATVIPLGSPYQVSEREASLKIRETMIYLSDFGWPDCQCLPYMRLLCPARNVPEPASRRLMGNNVVNPPGNEVHVMHIVSSSVVCCQAMLTT